MKDIQLNLEIFILTYNRPEALVKAVESVKRQSNRNFKLIVSDNSIDLDKIKNIFKNDLEVEVRQRGGMSPLEHIQLCFNEASGDLVCLFHDDDEMMPNYVDKILEEFQNKPQLQAVATNAIVKNTVDGSKGISFKSSRENLYFNNKNDFLYSYFGKGNCGIAPFPSYTFRTINNKFKGYEELGKYGDVAICASQLSYGEVCWINLPLIKYYITGGNGGAVESMKDRLKLLAYLKKNNGISQFIVNQYRVLIYGLYLNSNKLTLKRKIYKLRQKLKIRRLFHFMTISNLVQCVLHKKIKFL